MTQASSAVKGFRISVIRLASVRIMHRGMADANVKIHRQERTQGYDAVVF